MKKRTRSSSRRLRELRPTIAQQALPAAPQRLIRKHDISVECGWGKLIMAQTYHDAGSIAEALEDEGPGRRHIAMYVQDPHVVISQAPHQIFLDPSHTFRLWLDQYQPGIRPHQGYRIRRLRSRADADGINHLYMLRQMVPVDPAAVWKRRTSRTLTYIVAEDLRSGTIIGTATGIDHVHAFDDPEGGASLWCLAVDPQAAHPGVGEALTRYLAEMYQTRGREFMDLSVLHSNKQAIALYKKLGFRRVPVFALKRKNAINEALFVAPGPEHKLNIYAQIIVNEALRRGVRVDILDAKEGYFRLSLGGRAIVCRESLSELTSAVAMSRCQDKHVTHRVLEAAELKLPAQHLVANDASDTAFLQQHGAVVVKPDNAEQGHGISVDVRDEDSLRASIEQARRHGERTLLEQYCPGEDLRIIVIGFEVVAAAVRKPPVIIGDGQHSVRELIEKLSRRRAAATGGESRIPLDEETRRCLALSGVGLDDILDAEHGVEVRKTANLHTGGTIHDVTDRLHPELAAAAAAAARALDIPVVGLDFMVAAPDQPEYVIIEANERPGLANHEPQPTAERFLDLLFPLSAERDVFHAQA